MARFRWFSTFTLLGFLLIVLGIVGKVLGPKFIYDPGQIPDGNEAWAYIAVGMLMLLNGLLSPASQGDDAARPVRAPAGKAASAPASPAATARVGDRTAD